MLSDATIAEKRTTMTSATPRSFDRGLVAHIRPPRGRLAPSTAAAVADGHRERHVDDVPAACDLEGRHVVAELAVEAVLPALEHALVHEERDRGAPEPAVDRLVVGDRRGDAAVREAPVGLETAVPVRVLARLEHPVVVRVLAGQRGEL